MSQVNFDLLGDPIPDGRGEVGRTGHIATAENVKKIRTLLLTNLTKQRIADELGVSVPTLNKHYFASGRISLRHAREMALAEARARNFLHLDRAAEAGNVSAIKEMGRRIDQLDLTARAKGFGEDQAKPAKRTVRRAPIGKKEIADEEARRIGDGGGAWGDDLLPGFGGGERPN